MIRRPPRSPLFPSTPLSRSQQAAVRTQARPRHATAPLRPRVPARQGGRAARARPRRDRSEEHTSELQSRPHLVCRLLLEKKKKISSTPRAATPDCVLTIVYG